MEDEELKEEEKKFNLPSIDFLCETIRESLEGMDTEWDKKHNESLSKTLSKLEEAEKEIDKMSINNKDKKEIKEYIERRRKRWQELLTESSDKIKKDYEIIAMLKNKLSVLEKYK